MNTLDITRALADNKVTKTVFRGVFPADTLPRLNVTDRVDLLPAAYVANCSNAVDNGSHWIAFYREKPDVIEIFDSYGKPVDTYNKNLLSIIPEGTAIVQQSQQLQQTESTVCGQYCLFFILKRAFGISYKQLIHLFTDNLLTNDKMVCQFVNNYFTLNTPVYDKTMMMSLMTGPVP